MKTFAKHAKVTVDGGAIYTTIYEVPEYVCLCNVPYVISAKLRQAENPFIKTADVATVESGVILRVSRYFRR